MTRTQVKVIFAAAPQHNYVTSVSDKQTDSMIRSYFVNTSFNMGVFPAEDLAVCTDVVITRQDSIDTGMDAATDALFKDLMETFPNLPLKARRVAKDLAAKGYRK